MKDEIVHLALENLEKETGITGRWKKRGDVDGEITLRKKGLELHYYVEVKKEVRLHQLGQLSKYREQYDNLMLIAEHIFPKVKAELRELNIPYLEANGNIHIKKDPVWLWVDTKRPITMKKETGNRAFTKTGLKVLFYLLQDKNNINNPQRVIASHTGVALGNIPKVIKGLKGTGYLLQLDKKTYAWEKKEELFNRWITEYETTLKPQLLMGRFDLPGNWKDLKIDNVKEAWGGEPAGDILTGYLRPGELELFTTRNWVDFIKKYKLKPDENGELKVYELFWNKDKPAQTVPPLLVYTDLKLKNNKRCNETAEMVWNEYIQPNI